MGPILRSLPAFGGAKGDQGLLRLGVAGLAEPGETGKKIAVEFPGVGDPGYMVRLSEMPRGLPRGFFTRRCEMFGLAAGSGAAPVSLDHYGIGDEAALS